MNFIGKEAIRTSNFQNKPVDDYLKEANCLLAEALKWPIWSQWNLTEADQCAREDKEWMTAQW